MRLYVSLMTLGTIAVLAAACKDDGPTFGAIRVSVATTGGDVDLDGYTLSLDGSPAQAVDTNASVLISRLPTGSHQVELAGVAQNCSVSGGNPRFVTIRGGQTAEVAFAIGCVPTGVAVTVATGGVDVDLDGYAVSVDGAPPRAVPVNGSVSITRLTAGTHTVTLSGMAANCTVPGGTNPHSVVLAAGEVVPVGFPITCVAVHGVVEVTAATAGIDLDPSGYTVQLDSGAPQALPVNGTVRFNGVTGGEHTVTLAGMAGNCPVSGDNPRRVSVTIGGVTRDTARTTVQATCVAVTGMIEVTAATMGFDLDPDGYTVQLDAGTPQPLPVSGTVRFGTVSEGEHTVTLAGMAGNCPVSGDNPRTVSVTTGGVTRDTARTTFEVTCHWATGMVVTLATSGSELDVNGYLVGVDVVCYSGWYGDYCDYVWSEWASANDTVRFATVPVGEHAVYLDDIAPNCRLAAANPSTATVPPGQAATVTFAVTCEQSGSVRVSVTTTGADLDPDGYRLQVQGAEYLNSHYVGANASVTISQLLAGEYSVTLSGLAANCTANGQNPVTATVVAGATVDVALAVTCAALSRVQVTAVTTGVDLDTDGYSVRVQAPWFDNSDGVPANGTVTISGLPAGDYLVALSGVAANCEVGGANPRTVTVPSGGTAVVQFDVVCAALAQLAVVMSDGDEEIYLIKSNGTGLTRLTTNTVSDVQPAWSPDGGKIAFATNRGGNYEIYVMDGNGQNPVPRTMAAGADHSPAWSPDGSKIAFTSDRDGNAEIYVMDAGGSNPVRLTNHPGSDADPAWSPDGSKIAFTSNRDGNGEIYVMDPAGSGLTRLTSNDVDDAQPEWSPDGRKVVFSRLAWCDSYTSFCDYDLFVMNADGSGAAQLTFASSDTDPAWSPDGRWIAYGAGFCSYGWYYDCYYDHSAVQLVRADGTVPVEVLRNTFQPAWRP